MNTKMIEIKQNDNGSHNNQTVYGVAMAIPEGWALVPEDLDTPNFPFGDVTVEDGIDPSDPSGATICKIVKTWAARETPVPPVVTYTGSEMRERAYNEWRCINWEDEQRTVTDMAQKWDYYAAEDNTEKMSAITATIVNAKGSIRAMYPDREEGYTDNDVTWNPDGSTKEPIPA